MDEPNRSDSRSPVERLMPSKLPDEVARLRAAIAEVLELPVHSIGGYEWECSSDCHYHWSPSMTKYPCVRCGGNYTVEAEFDRDGVRCDHDSLLDANRIRAILEPAR